jgi:DNA-binding winged helix-turn-helix (wHTH) protein
MAQQTESPALVRFGAFEVDLRTGELRKQGKRIKLQEQPFQVLSVLLQHPGDVVTRDDLRSQIWPQNTFVDFDNSLNTAINKLREALGDSADTPRFVETLPRRGYRFLAPVSGDGREAQTKSTDKWKIGLIAAIVIVAGVVAMAGGMLWHSRHRRVLSEKDTIVLGDFANSTGDAVFDGTLREGLSVQLQQSPFLSLVSGEGIQQTLQMMGQPTNIRLTPQIAREVCQRTNSKAALDGSIALIGTRYDLIVKAMNCVNGDLLASTEAQANDKSHVLDALNTTASEIRRKLGESLSTVQKYDTPLEQATTPSLEALQAFSLGVKASLAGDVAAVAFFQRAVQLDPNFAAAYDEMGGENQWIGTALALENMRKAFELRSRVSEREKLIIEGDYYSFVTGDLVKARQSFILGEQIYPREVNFRTNLGVLDNALGQYEAGLRENQEAVRLAPSPINYRFLAYTYLSVNRDEDAAALAREAHGKGLDSGLGAILYSLAFYRNDSAEMSRQVAAWAGKPDQEYLMLALEADTAAYFGHLGRARELSRQASSSAKRAGENEISATYEAVAALREGLFGYANQAGKRTALAKERSGGPDKYYAVVLALAYTGDESQGLADNFNESFPENTVVKFNYLPTLRAKLALNHANPQEALDILRVASPYELGLPTLWFYNWPNLYPVYLRGEAYLAAHQGNEAAAEFQEILDHRGIVLNEPIGALAHLQLGRAYAMQRNVAKSRAAYDDFLALWKDADPDVPVLKQAKAEYAKLQ